MPSAATGKGLGNYTITYVNGTLTVNPSIIVLDPTASGALSISGNASITSPAKSYVDSSSSIAVVGQRQRHGSRRGDRRARRRPKSGNASFSPAPTTGAATLADPLSAADAEHVRMTNYGSENLSGNSSATINPGIYSQISARATPAHMNSGVYIIEGGGFSVSGNASVSGSGVMIFNAGSKYPEYGRHLRQHQPERQRHDQPEPTDQRDLCRHRDLPADTTIPRPSRSAAISQE